jgi:hypothetical protein
MRPLIISLAFALLAARGAAADQDGGVPDSWLGAWRLNAARSDYGSAPAPYKRAGYRIERTGDGFRVIYDMVHPRGGTTHLEWTGRMDGRDYALQGLDQVITYAYTLAGAGACDVVVKIDGRVAARSRVTVSPDGRTMTTRTMTAGPGGQSAVSTTVYERQPES